MTMHSRFAGVSGSYPQPVHKNVCGATAFVCGMVDDCRTIGLQFGLMPDDSDSSELIRPHEAARIAGVTTRALANWADAGKLAVIRLPGGERRYRRADIIALATPTIVA